MLAKDHAACFILTYRARGVTLQEKAYEIFSDLKIPRFWDRIGGFSKFVADFSDFSDVLNFATITHPCIKIYRNGS